MSALLVAGARRAAAWVVASIVALSLLAPSAATAQNSGVETGAVLSGTVTWEHPWIKGTIIAELVTAEDRRSLASAVLVDEKGHYAFTDVEDGSYKVRFWDEDGVFLTEWWNDRQDFASAETVVIQDGASVAGIDASLTRDSRILGNVYFGDHGDSFVVEAFSASDPRVPVGIYDSDRPFLDWDRPNGYGFMHLRAGDYKLRFTAKSGGHYTQWWKGAASFGDAAVISLAAGQVKDDIDFAPVFGSAIRGRVTFPSGTVRIAGDTHVRLYKDDDPNKMIASAPVGMDGRYALKLIPAGSYRMYISTSNATARSEWWNDGSSFAEADRLTIGEGQLVNATEVALSSDRSVIWSSPRISGTPKDGATLTAATGTWSRGTQFSYRWLADGVAITGGIRSSLTLTQAQAGKKITVRVTGMKSGLTAESKVSAPTSRVLRLLASERPTISGSPVVGKTLTAQPGRWTSGTTFRYQWSSDGKVLAGETGRTLSLTNALAGRKIAVAVQGSKPGYASKNRSSTPLGPATGGKLTAGTPQLSGKVTVGEKLTAVPGSWTPGTTFTYQWLANGQPIPKATGKSHTLTSNDGGKKIAVRVTGSRPGFSTVSKVSAAKSVLRSLTSTAPKISGSVATGTTLKALTGSWTPGTTFAYQWTANGKPIPKATAAHYKVVSAQKGMKIRVTVTGSKAGYASKTRTSTAALSSAER